MPVRLRPHSHLFQEGVLACVAFMTPVFIVLWVLTVPDGPWPAVLVTQLLATLVVTLASVAYFRTAIWVDPQGLTERGFFGIRTRFPIERIGSIVAASTFEGMSERVYPQLFVCDHEGRLLVRMRGQFWSQDNMDVVVETLDVPFTPVGDAVSTRELRSDYPGLLYWFERHPVLAALAFSVATAVVGFLVFVVFRAFGAPA